MQTKTKDMKNPAPTQGIFDVREAIAEYRRGMTAREVARVFGISEDMVYKSAREQTIPS